MMRRELAYRAARLSELAYERRRTIEPELPALGLNLTAWWDHADTQGFLARNDKQAFIVFRGTEASKGSFSDIGSNFTWWPVRWQGVGRVHSGYRNHFNMISARALAMAEDVSSETVLFVTGHSLGGALAGLFASWYYSTYPKYNLAALITFGAPKSMNRKAGQAIRCLTRRYVMPGDFAPSWPPVFGLVHHVEETRLVPPINWPGPISRHDVSGYRSALWG